MFIRSHGLYNISLKWIYCLQRCWKRATIIFQDRTNFVSYENSTVTYRSFNKFNEMLFTSRIILEWERIRFKVEKDCNENCVIILAESRLFIDSFVAIRTSFKPFHSSHHCLDSPLNPNKQHHSKWNTATIKSVNSWSRKKYSRKVNDKKKYRLKLTPLSTPKFDYLQFGSKFKKILSKKIILYKTHSNMCSCWAERTLACARGFRIELNRI